MSITSSSHLAPDDVARHTFGSVRRGFDPNEVRAYLESIAMGLRTIAEREQRAPSELADAEHRAANPGARRGRRSPRRWAPRRPGCCTALTRWPRRWWPRRRRRPNDCLAEANRQAEQGRGSTPNPGWPNSQPKRAKPPRPSSASGPTSRSWRGLEAARSEADELLAQAREQCRAMVEEAQGLRTRVLADLARRRKVLHAQIEQLRAGRERLTETVQDVRRSVDAIAEDLFAAEDNARLAAEAAGREAADTTRRGHARGDGCAVARRGVRRRDAERRGGA